MDILSIPFVRHTGIERSDQGLQLVFADKVQNHLQTMHASAQFTLAETASGDFLQEAFPELAGKVIPVLRDAQVKFKSPALTTVTAISAIDEEAKEVFQQRIEKKGRAIISVRVELKDAENKLTLMGEFNWFIQKVDE